MLAYLGLVGSSLAIASDPVEFFEQRIRPVLVEHCYECHGHKPKQLKVDCGLTPEPVCGQVATRGPPSSLVTSMPVG